MSQSSSLSLQLCTPSRRHLDAGLLHFGDCQEPVGAQHDQGGLVHSFPRLLTRCDRGRGLRWHAWPTLRALRRSAKMIG
eukprot:6172417-Pleurochrysis_carterae.AAC.1